MLLVINARHTSSLTFLFKTDAFRAALLMIFLFSLHKEYRTDDANANNFTTVSYLVFMKNSLCAKIYIKLESSRLKYDICARA